MSSVEYISMDKKVTLAIDSGHRLVVLLNEKTLAKFDLQCIWDMVKTDLAEVSDTDSPGLKRRAYEARNVDRLTQEYLTQMTGDDNV